MAHFVLSKQDFQGYGLYEKLPGYSAPSRAMAGYGASPLDFLLQGQTAALETLLQQSVTKDALGFRSVRADAKGQVITLLQTQQFFQDFSSAQPKSTSTTRYGVAAPGAPQPSWVKGLLASGFVVMVGVIGSTAAIVATKEPPVIAAERGSYTIVDGPAALVNAARALAQAGAGSKTPVCPGGQTFVNGKCLDIPGGVEDLVKAGAQSDLAKLATEAYIKKHGVPPGALTGALPSWVLPAAVVTAGAIAAAVIYKLIKKSPGTAATPNFRHW